MAAASAPPASTQSPHLETRSSWDDCELARSFRPLAEHGYGLTLLTSLATASTSKLRSRYTGTRRVTRPAMAAVSSTLEATCASRRGSTPPSPPPSPPATTRPPRLRRRRRHLRPGPTSHPTRPPRPPRPPRPRRPRPRLPVKRRRGSRHSGQKRASCEVIHARGGMSVSESCSLLRLSGQCKWCRNAILGQTVRELF